MHSALKVLAVTARTFLLLLIASAIVVSGLLAWTMHKDGIRLMSVQTGSMSPMIVPGDGLIVKQASPASLQVGDVISYHSSNSPELIISHRLVLRNTKNRLLTTRGDKNAHNDQPFAEQQLIGKVIAVAPGLGKALERLRSPWCLVPLLYLPALTICTNEIKRLSRHYNRRYYRLFA